jgi:predicted amidophosphoribosyltransferase
MLEDTSLRKTPQRIDELTRGEHPHLHPEDECYYFADYTSRAGYGHSQANQLVFNFKKPMDRRAYSDWQFKTTAIRQIGDLFAHTLGQSKKELTLVPVPPSKVPPDPNYDNRLLMMLTHVRKIVGPAVDVRELVTQTQNRAAAHESPNRPSVAELMALYQIDELKTVGVRDRIVIVDDVLTNGTSFRAMKTVLSAKFPDSAIIGLYLARTVRERPNFSDIFEI